MIHECFKCKLVLNREEVLCSSCAALCVGADVRRRCQNCGHAAIIRQRGERRGMPMIICQIDPRAGWDRTREWGDNCDKWVKSNEKAEGLR